jgi:hypothetical protein
MRSPARLVRFVVTAIVLFVVFRALGSTGFYPPMFRAAAAPFIGHLGGHRIVRLEPFQHPQGLFDTRLSLGTDVGGTPEFRQDLLLDTVRVDYAPTACVLALLLATPIAWSRKGRALVAGLGLVHAFIALRFALQVIYGFSLAGGRTELGMLGFATEILSSDYHVTYVAAIVIWLFVTRNDGRYLPFFFPAAPGEPVALAARGAAP